jgi:hypothetical protein
MKSTHVAVNRMQQMILRHVVCDPKVIDQGLRAALLPHHAEILLSEIDMMR